MEDSSQILLLAVAHLGVGCASTGFAILGVAFFIWVKFRRSSVSDLSSGLAICLSCLAMLSLFGFWYSTDAMFRANCALETWGSAQAMQAQRQKLVKDGCPVPELQSSR